MSDFDEYRREIMSRLDRQDEDTGKLDRKMDRILTESIPSIHTQIALLKAGAYQHGARAGAITGLLTALATAVAAYFLKAGGAH